VKKKAVLDSFALLAFLGNEDGCEKVKRLLADKDIQLLMNEINVGESYYIIARERGLAQADEFVDAILPSLPIILVANSLAEVIEAARIKAEYPLAYADCFVASTACRKKAPVITGDPEFKKVQQIIEIDWL
jgi:predicted nucleic acid-binding protein